MLEDTNSLDGAQISINCQTDSRIVNKLNYQKWTIFTLFLNNQLKIFNTSIPYYDTRHKQ